MYKSGKKPENRIHNRTKYFLNGRPAVDIARENGISKEKFTDRIQLGWSIEKACTYKRLTARELAIKMDVDEKKIRSLRSQGYTWEELEAIANGRKI